MTDRLSIIWFRLDLRLADNSALQAGAGCGRMLPVFIWAPEEEAPWEPGGASRWWLHQSLQSVAREVALEVFSKLKPAGGVVSQ